MEKKLVVDDDMVVGIAYALFVDGKEEDRADENDPLEYLHGHANIISGLEDALTGKTIGDSVSVDIAPEDAYGEWDEEDRFDLERDMFPEDADLEVGEIVHLSDDEDHVVPGIIVDFNDETVTVDLNHPLAGKKLHFDVKIVSIRPATEDEIEAGQLESDDEDEDYGCSDDCCSCGHCG